MKINEELENSLLFYIQNNIKKIDLENGMREQETYPSEESLNQKLDIKDEKLLKELKESLKDRKSLKIKNFDNLFIDIKDNKNIYELTNKNSNIRLNNMEKDKIFIDINIDEEIMSSESYSNAEEQFLIENYYAESDYKYDQMKDDLLTGY